MNPAAMYRNIFKGNSKMNLNVLAAYVHVIGDLVQAIGVLIAAFIIFFKPTYVAADPICTLIFAVLVAITCFKTTKSIILILMEATPSHVNIDKVYKKLLKIEGVNKIHDLHIWAITNEKLSLTCHISSVDPEITMTAATEMLVKEFNISHTTLQVEQFNRYCQDNCENNIHN